MLKNFSYSNHNRCVFSKKKKKLKVVFFLKNFLVISNQSIKITFETLTINLDKSCHIAADVLYAEFRHICKKKLSAKA